MKSNPNFSSAWSFFDELNEFFDFPFLFCPLSTIRIVSIFALYWRYFPLISSGGCKYKHDEVNILFSLRIIKMKGDSKKLSFIYIIDVI